LVELAPLPDRAADEPATVVGATLGALGLRERPGEAPLDTLVAHLQTRRLLLVLDNCEHVAAAAAGLAARLLAACPGLRVLATSQQPLGAAAEVVWPVAPLAVPALVEGTPPPETVRSLGEVEAVQLFVARAQAVRPGFVLSA